MPTVAFVGITPAVASLHVTLAVAAGRLALERSVVGGLEKPARG